MTICYLIGSPRSGTTWLQRLLAGHPQIASGQETDLWTGYIAPWFYKWDLDLPDDPQQWARQRHKGLPAILTVEDFEQIARAAVDTVNSRLLALKPSATVILDKTPANAKHVNLISRLNPEARFLHIIRDGRDVADSLVRAQKGWGRGWAPASTARAGSLWAETVRSAFAARTGQYLEVRYEELRADTAQILAACFRFLDVSVADAEVGALIAAQALPAADAQHGNSKEVLLWGGEVIRRLGAAPPEPAGFFGEGASGAWKEWSPRDRLSFDRVAGDLLVELGYEKDRTWASASAGDRAMLWANDRSQAAIASARRKLGKRFPR